MARPTSAVSRLRLEFICWLPLPVERALRMPSSRFGKLPVSPWIFTALLYAIQTLWLHQFENKKTKNVNGERDLMNVQVPGARAKQVFRSAPTAAAGS